MLSLPKPHERTMARIKKTRGFTLVELVVVIVILGILATVGVFTYAQITDNARDKSIESTISQFHKTYAGALATGATANNAATTAKANLPTGVSLTTVGNGVTRTNGVVNPSFEIDEWWSSPATTTLTYTTTEKVLGNRSLVATANNTTGTSTVALWGPSAHTIIGNSYTISAYVKLPAGTSGTKTLFPRIDYKNASNVATAVIPGANYTIDADNWTRVQVSGVAPANTAYMTPTLQMPGQSNGGRFIVDAFMVEQGGLGDYFDGTSPRGSWTAATHASTSQLAPQQSDLLVQITQNNRTWCYAVPDENNFTKAPQLSENTNRRPEPGYYRTGTC